MRGLQKAVISGFESRVLLMSTRGRSAPGQSQAGPGEALLSQLFLARGQPHPENIPQAHTAVQPLCSPRKVITASSPEAARSQGACIRLMMFGQGSLLQVLPTSPACHMAGEGEAGPRGQGAPMLPPGGALRKDLWASSSRQLGWKSPAPLNQVSRPLWGAGRFPAFWEPRSHPG